MKNIRTFALVIVSVMLLLVIAAPVAAGTPTRIDLSGTIFNSCAPQDGPIAYTGFAQFTPNQDGSTNIIAKVSGVSATGVKYQISEIEKITSTEASFSQAFRLHLVSQGSSDNYFVTVTFSYDPINGYQATFDTACRG